MKKVWRVKQGDTIKMKNIKNKNKRKGDEIEMRKNVKNKRRWKI